MAIELKDVKHWAQDWDKVSHIAMNRNGHWVATACGSLMTSEIRKRVGKRGVCAKCRAAMKDIQPKGTA